MLVTFGSGQMALQALEYDGQTTSDQAVTVRLKSPDWQEMIRAEMQLLQSNSVALFNTTTNSLLGEDFSIPTMSFDMDGESYRRLNIIDGHAGQACRLFCRIVIRSAA